MNARFCLSILWLLSIGSATFADGSGCDQVAAGVIEVAQRIHVTPLEELKALRVQGERPTTTSDARAFLDKFSASYLSEVEALSAKETNDASSRLQVNLEHLRDFDQSFLGVDPRSSDKVLVTSQICRRLSKEDRVVFIHGFYSTRHLDELAGFAAMELIKRKNGDLEANLEFVKRNPRVQAVDGFALNLVKHDLKGLRRLGVKRSIVEAGWLGRIVWHKLGYRFRHDILFEEREGDEVRTYSQVALIRRNFSRFLAQHHLPLSELTVHGRRVASVDELIDPADFIDIEHPTRTLDIAPYVDDGIVDGVRVLPIGRAFALGSYLSYPAQVTKVRDTYGNKDRSDTALPAWWGVIELEQ